MKALEPGHILVFKGVQLLATGSFVCWRKSISGLGVLSGMNMKSALRSAGRGRLRLFREGQLLSSEGGVSYGLSTLEHLCRLVQEK